MAGSSLSGHTASARRFLHHSCLVATGKEVSSSLGTALSFTTVVPMDPTTFSTTHKVVHLLDRKNQLQMDICTVSEVS